MISYRRLRPPPTSAILHAYSHKSTSLGTQAVTQWLSQYACETSIKGCRFSITTLAGLGRCRFLATSYAYFRHNHGIDTATSWSAKSKNSFEAVQNASCRLPVASPAPTSGTPAILIPIHFQRLPYCGPSLKVAQGLLNAITQSTCGWSWSAYTWKSAIVR